MINAWGALGRRGRVIVAVDSSGSMAGTLPGSRRRRAVSRRRRSPAVAVCDRAGQRHGAADFTASRNRDYRVLRHSVRPRPGGQGFTPAGTAVKDHSLQPVPNGGTGLYDTTLAAFRAASKNYAYGRLNAVMVITDGNNQDPGSPSP